MASLFRSPVFRSLNEEILTGTSLAAMSTTALPAKSALLPARSSPDAFSASISFDEAEAKTSVGAPASICFWRTPEAAKLKTIFEPGFFFSYALPISSKGAFRLSAAETSSSEAAHTRGAKGFVRTRKIAKRALRLYHFTIFLPDAGMQHLKLHVLVFAKRAAGIGAALPAMGHLFDMGCADIPHPRDHLVRRPLQGRELGLGDERNDILNVRAFHSGKPCDHGYFDIVYPWHVDRVYFHHEPCVDRINKPPLLIDNELFRRISATEVFPAIIGPGVNLFGHDMGQRVHGNGYAFHADSHKVP